MPPITVLDLACFLPEPGSRIVYALESISRSINLFLITWSCSLSLSSEYLFDESNFKDLICFSSLVTVLASGF